MAYRDPRTALRALTEIAVSQGGYFTARQAAEAGYGSSHLRYHLAAGNFEPNSTSVRSGMQGEATRRT